MRGKGGLHIRQTQDDIRRYTKHFSILPHPMGKTHRLKNTLCAIQYAPFVCERTPAWSPKPPEARGVWPCGRKPRGKVEGGKQVEVSWRACIIPIRSLSVEQTRSRAPPWAQYPARGKAATRYRNKGELVRAGKDDSAFTRPICA